MRSTVSRFGGEGLDDDQGVEGLDQLAGAVQHLDLVAFHVDLHERDGGEAKAVESAGLDDIAPAADAHLPVLSLG
jgi:hypothetical protein